MMKKPILFVLDDDPQVLAAIRADLRSHFRSGYRLMSTISAREALDTLPSLKNKGEEVALFLSDQRMPEMQGVDFLEAARKIYPEAKRVLLTAYSDTEAAIRAINEVQLDYYLLKPWNPPEERLFPVLDDLLLEWQAQHSPNFQGIRIVGYPFSPQTHSIKDFLASNLIPYRFLNIENSEEARELAAANTLEDKDLPTVFLEDGERLKNPELSEIAVRLGLNVEARESLYDVAIIGAGPAGLAAGVYGGSEGLKTLLIDRKAPGGQAGTSSRIENYLGFPKGLSGSDLARRAITQATRFGIEFLSPVTVEGITFNDPYKTLHLEGGNKIQTRAVVIATGVDYRKLNNEGMDALTGSGIYYGAATTEANSCQDGDVYIVGGGNSAGQGAMYLSKFARKVNIVIRRKGLESTMSQYLIDQIGNTENIEILTETEVTKAMGETRLEAIELTHNPSGKVETKPATALFIFIGARPYTEWTGDELLKDAKGFLLTGSDVLNHPKGAQLWKSDTPPFLLETSIPGIFASGDVRSGAMNRVASAVGEGSMAISFVHKYLAEH